MDKSMKQYEVFVLGPLEEVVYTFIDINVASSTIMHEIDWTVAERVSTAHFINSWPIKSMYMFLSAMSTAGSSSSNIDSEGEVSTGIELGFATKANENDILLHNDPDWRDWEGGKLGGTPTHLIPLKNLIYKPTDFTCNQPSCNSNSAAKDNLSFLLQLYCPIESPSFPQSFHRSLYVFICRRCSKCVKVFRAQLPKQSPFYPVTPSNRKKKDNDATTIGKDDEADHQFKLGERFQTCYSIEIEPEVDYTEESESEEESSRPEVEDVSHGLEDEVKDEDMTQKDLNKIARTLLPESISGLALSDDLENDVKFKNFQKRIKYYSDQIVRYSLWKMEEPLWVTSNNVINYDETGQNIIPKCQNCSAERKFEFQIMPQILNYLDNEHSQLDFATIVVYTCMNSCSSKIERKNNEEANDEATVNKPDGIDAVSEYCFVEEFAYIQHY